MSPKPDLIAWSPGRRLVAGIAGILFAMVWIQPAAAILRAVGGGAEPPAAVVQTVLAALATGLGAALLPHRRAWIWAGLSALFGGAVTALAGPSGGSAPIALAVVVAVATVGARWLGARLPAGVDVAWTRRRALALLWVAASLVSVVQVGRLSAFMSDREIDFAVVNRNPFWYKHECLPAYLYGAELAGKGESNLYDPAHYPGLNPEAEPESALVGMAVEDPYQYPPQFLLLPTAAIAMTHDASLIRVAWFALQASLFAAAFAALALWAGGRAGKTALWLLPVALSAFPMLFNFQFGQFHLATLALAVLGMVAFARERRVLGGLLLASAILAKLFPVVLVVYLLGRRRFRELAWTAAWGVGITALADAVLGPAPFAAFLGEHLPRMASGAAFAFDEVWPELASWVVLDNQGIFGLARKLGFAKPLASQAAQLFSLGLMLLAAWFGARLRGSDRIGRATTWVALLGLASLTSAGAWGDYVPTAAIWLLALVAHRASDGARWAVPIGMIAVFQYFLLGTLPIGEWGPYAIMLPLATTGLILMLALFGGTLGLSLRGSRATAGDRGEVGEVALPASTELVPGRVVVRNGLRARHRPGAVYD